MFGKKILVVGAGPVGLSAALFLNKAAQTVSIIERKVDRNVYSKALLTNTRTLSLLNTVGVDRDILKHGSELQGMKFFFNQKPVFQVILNDHKIDSKSLYGQKVTLLPQSQTQNILQNKLNQQGLFVRRGVELLSAKNIQDFKVEAVLKQDNQTKRQIYDMMIGCDGARSSVRHNMDAKFQGNTIQNNPMYMADYQLPQQIVQPKGKIRLYQTPQPYVLVVIPISKNIVRVISNLKDFESVLPSELNQRKQIWKSQFSINHRLSSKLQQGNIYLAGDAGHVHSPLGGRGMNIGIEDVYVFTQLLKRNQLKNYEEERYKVLKPLISRVRRTSQFIMAPSELKYSALGLILRNLNWLMPEIGYKNLVRFITGQDHDI